MSAATVRALIEEGLVPGAIRHKRHWRVVDPPAREAVLARLRAEIVREADRALAAARKVRDEADAVVNDLAELLDAADREIPDLLGNDLRQFHRSDSAFHQAHHAASSRTIRLILLHRYEREFVRFLPDVW